MAELGEPRREEPLRGAAVWREFRRARYALWGSLLLIVLLGAALHDVLARSLLARASWLLGVIALIGYPLRYLLGFRCPRCGGVFLATGRLRDFLGLGRIIWGSRCGACSLPTGAARELGPPSSRGIRESGPIL